MYMYVEKNILLVTDADKLGKNCILFYTFNVTHLFSQFYVAKSIRVCDSRSHACLDQLPKREMKKKIYLKHKPSLMFGKLLKKHSSTIT